MPTARRQGRRWVLLAVAVAVAAAVASAVLLASGDDDDPRTGSAALDAGPRLEVTRTPDSYRIEYRVETRTGDDVRTSSERLTVLRPFASRLERFSDRVPKGRPVSRQDANFGRLQLAGAGVENAIVAAPPAAAPGDSRIGSVLDEAVDAGFLERKERRRVAGRVCQVYRSASLLGATQTLGPLDGAEGAEHADTCIDEAGLILEEVLFNERGDVRVRRIAMAVEEEPDLEDELFEVGAPSVPPDQGGGVVARLTPASRTPEAFWDLAAPPEGFDHRGRYAVVPPQVEAFTDPLQRDRRLGSVIDVYVDGADVILVDRGGTIGNVDVFADVPHAERVDVSALGTAEVLLGATGAEVRVDLGSGKFVRIMGTMPSAELVDIARRMEEVEGGELEVLEEG